MSHESKIDRLHRQRDRAWDCLQRIEEALGTASAEELAFILADSHGPDDVEEWNALVDAANTKGDGS